MYVCECVCVCVSVFFVSKRDINVEMRDSRQYVISVGLPNVEFVKRCLEVNVEWQYTHVGQTLHRLKD